MFLDRPKQHSIVVVRASVAFGALQGGEDQLRWDGRAGVGSFVGMGSQKLLRVRASARL
jgi:hypothetical protein